MQEARKAELSLPGAPWKGTSLSGTSGLPLCAVRKVQTDIYGGTSGCFTLGNKSALGLPTVSKAGKEQKIEEQSWRLCVQRTGLPPLC